MGEKIYKPIIKDGDHLIPSKSNPDRLRGLTRNVNSQNPDIPEWEKFDFDDLKSGDFSSDLNGNHSVELTPEQERVAQILGAFFASASAYWIDKYVFPWWKGTAWP